ncbi:MAG: hydroxyacylglutathione hydrolase [Candidatus Comchoanobacterales bacterium]
MRQLSLHRINPKSTDNNIIWLLEDGQNVIIIDPGKSDEVLNWLQYNPHLKPYAILVTHGHQDHTDGIETIISRYPTALVYSPHGVLTKMKNTYTIPLKTHTINAFVFGPLHVFYTPGHTAEHLCYQIDQYLFTGDTLFYGGCGRAFYDINLLFHSLNQLHTLSDDLIVCCGHDYTLNNLKFAKLIDPDNPALENRIKHITIPATLGTEKQTNPFLQIHNSKYFDQIVRRLNDLNQQNNINRIFLNISQVKDLLKNTLQNVSKETYDRGVDHAFQLFQCLRELKNQI